MSTIEMMWTNSAVTQNVPEDKWRQTTAYRLHVLVSKDEDEADSFSAIVLNLLGAGSSGATEEEALENVKEAAQGILEDYKDSGEEIPWKDTSEVNIPPGAKQKWIIVDA
jgi:predicted RNase H-like HicB family nuclease